MQRVSRRYKRKGLRAVRHVDASDDDGVRAMLCVGDHDPFDVVALIPLAIAQALANYFYKIG